MKRIFKFFTMLLAFITGLFTFKGKSNPKDDRISPRLPKFVRRIQNSTYKPYVKIGFVSGKFKRRTFLYFSNIGRKTWLRRKIEYLAQIAWARGMSLDQVLTPNLIP